MKDCKKHLWHKNCKGCKTNEDCCACWAEHNYSKEKTIGPLTKKDICVDNIKYVYEGTTEIKRMKTEVINVSRLLEALKGLKESLCTCCPSESCDCPKEICNPCSKIATWFGKVMK